MENKRIVCPHCGYRMPVEAKPGAVARGLFLKCKGRNCGKVFEIILPPKAENNG